MDDMKSMEVEAISHTSPSLPHKSFRDIVTGVQHCFPEITFVVEQIQEALEEEIVIPDTPLQVSFSQDQLRVLRAPWRRTLMGKVLSTTVTYDVLFQRPPLR